MILQRYTFGSKSQPPQSLMPIFGVAYDIAKIYIWKQITTRIRIAKAVAWLLMILQRYTFGSKSQLCSRVYPRLIVAYDIAKIYIWKQITTSQFVKAKEAMLLMILQRYTFGSKSQHDRSTRTHLLVAYDIAKIYIWKQITTRPFNSLTLSWLLMILQRYTFGSKSQRKRTKCSKQFGCL